MKHVLILSYYFPPAPLAYSQRIGKLCKYLVRETDWFPHVISGDLPWEILPGKDETLLAEIPGNIFVDRVSNFMASGLASKLRALRLFRPVSIIRNQIVCPDPFADWIPKAISAAEARFPKGEGIDAILSCGPPNSAHVAGMHLSESWCKPLVMDMRDPWNPSAQRMDGFKAWGLRRALALEKRVYQVAAHIIINTTGAAAELKRRLPEFANKISVITNGFDPEDLDWQTGPALRNPGEPPGTVHFLNLGGLRGGHLESTFLKMLAEYLRARPEERLQVKVHFVGPDHLAVEQIASPLGLRDICRGYGLVPTNHIGRPLAEADIYLLLQQDTYACCIPSKLFNYLAGGRPIFAMVPEALKTELLGKIEESRHLFEFADEGEGFSALARIIERARQTRRFLQNGSFPNYALRYDRRTIARQVASVLDQVAGRGSANQSFHETLEP